MKSIARVLCASFALALMAGSVGCGGDASCEKVTDHVMSIMMAETTKLPEEAKKAMTEEMTKRKPEMIEGCKKETTKAQRTCMMAAKTMEDMQKCEKK